MYCVCIYRSLAAATTLYSPELLCEVRLLGAELELWIDLHRISWGVLSGKGNKQSRRLGAGSQLEISLSLILQGELWGMKYTTKSSCLLTRSIPFYMPMAVSHRQ